MDSKNFQKITSAQAGQIRNYINTDAPLMAGRKTLIFIDDNFQKQGWQAGLFQPWKKNKSGRTPILIKAGHLRRSFNFQISTAVVRFYSNIKYAKIHNQGGTITALANVNQFQRKYGANSKKSGTYTVKAHTRKMNTKIPRRQFAPYEGHESSVMNNAIISELQAKITSILTAI